VVAEVGAGEGIRVDTDLYWGFALTSTGWEAPMPPAPRGSIISLIMATDETFTFTMDLQDGYSFLVDFDQEGVPPLLIDEPAPLGEGAGPNAARMLAAAVGNCLSASALYCLRRARIDVQGMHTTVAGSLERNDAGRLRIGNIKVRIEPVVEASEQPRMRRCLELFEDFCVVTQSVRQGIEVDVAVQPVAERQPA
jgi:organic hydroperoxide reductase OsmC/OhrA